MRKWRLDMMSTVVGMKPVYISKQLPHSPQSTSANSLYSGRSTKPRRVPSRQSGGLLKHADAALLAAPPRLAQRSLHNLLQETAKRTAEAQEPARSEYYNRNHPTESLRLRNRLQRWRPRKRLSSG
jgi:hypothetical protein